MIIRWWVSTQFIYNVRGEETLCLGKCSAALSSSYYPIIDEYTTAWYLYHSYITRQTQEPSPRVFTSHWFLTFVDVIYEKHIE
jgi:hypothetical protein